jgi:predicted nucleotidyltransferase component of viral defense system
MDAIKMISEPELRNLAGEKKLNLLYLEKDYYLTVLLYFLKDMGQICFKGGTALNKIYLNHSRLSEDLDFASNASVDAIKKGIIGILHIHNDIFPRFEFDNQTKNFFRMKVYYSGPITAKNFIILDINGKASVILEPKNCKVRHFYENIPNFDIRTMNIDELFAEKIRTLIMRKQPRDYFDAYMLFCKGYKPDMDLARKKLKEAGEIFEIKKIFNNANKVYSNWNDIDQLTNKPVKYLAVIKRLQKEFKYK